MKRAIIAGQYEIAPEYKRYAIPGSFPIRYWDIITYEDEEELSAYLAGQQSFVQEPPEHWSFPYGQLDRNARRRGEERDIADYDDSPKPAPHVCARCQRPCKPQYRHCYRCHSYLQVKKRLDATA